MKKTQNKANEMSGYNYKDYYLFFYYNYKCTAIHFKISLEVIIKAPILFIKELLMFYTISLYKTILILELIFYKM
jgi:hypothetical protein